MLFRASCFGLAQTCRRSGLRWAEWSRIRRSRGSCHKKVPDTSFSQKHGRRTWRYQRALPTPIDHCDARVVSRQSPVRLRSGRPLSSGAATELPRPRTSWRQERIRSLPCELAPFLFVVCIASFARFFLHVLYENRVMLFGKNLLRAGGLEDSALFEHDIGLDFVRH